MVGKKFNLIRLYLLKERVHWFRIKLGFMMFPNIFAKILGGSLLTIFITLFHYIFAVPHFIFETVMWLINKEQFKMNMWNLFIESRSKILSFRDKEKIYRKRIN